jgi:hypothetical protein
MQVAIGMLQSFGVDTLPYGMFCVREDPGLLFLNRYPGGSSVSWLDRRWTVLKFREMYIT